MRPHALGCTARALAFVTARNTGTSTWTADAGNGLEAVDGSDPLHTADTRVRLLPGESVAPGASYTFSLALAATGTAGTYRTDWRMAGDLAAPFGQTTAHSSAAVSSAIEPKNGSHSG